MDWTLIVALLVLGAATGFVAGLLGIGGGMVLVPFLTMLFTLRAFRRTTWSTWRSQPRSPPSSSRRHPRCARITSAAPCCGRL